MQHAKACARTARARRTSCELIKVLNLENLSKEEIVTWLERLLDVNELKIEMDKVSNFFIVRGELSVEMAILKLHHL